MESFRLSTAWSHSHGEVDYKTKSGTSWRHSHLNQKPWHPLSYPNQSRNWIAEQTNAQRERRAEEVAREIEMMKAVSFMYVRPPGYNAESAKAAEIADERKKEDLDDPFQKPLEAPPEASSTKSGTAWSHSYLNQKPWHPFSYPNQCRKWIAEQTNAQRESRAEEVVREYAQESVEAREDLDDHAGDDEGEGLELQQQCYPREASNRDYIYEEMQDLIGSVPRPLVFKSTSRDDGRFGGFVEKIGSGSRKSQMVLFSKPPTLPTLPHSKKDDTPPIRWQKGELIGEGSFGKVYMGVNLDSGELLAVKQVLIAGNGASKKKTKARIRELEAEVELLKNLSHQNIVKYLGTVREDDSLNVLLELVPGGSISSILGKLGPFHESVIRRYTKQLLLGLEYLHKNEIMHRDIKGANILVDNEGCIKLADFGASKKVAEQCAKSFKGTICWMAPEVILQTGHSFSADIWSVGCTVIEMATGNPPWSQQYQEEMAVVHHIGKTKSHPHIPEHLSSEGKDFLLKCFEKEPDLRATASDLLQHPFVTGEYEKPCLVFHNSLRESINLLANEGLNIKNMINIGINNSSDDVCEMSNLRCSAYWNEANYDDDLCQIDDKNDFMVGGSNRLNSTFASADLNKSFNPMYEPNDDGSCKFGETPESDRGGGIFFSSRQEVNPMCEPSASIVYEKIQKKFDDADARLGVERRIADIGNQLTHLTQLMEAMRSQFDSWFTKQEMLRQTGKASSPKGSREHSLYVISPPILRENNPELAGDRRRTVMRPPQVLLEGMKKTVSEQAVDRRKTVIRPPLDLREGTKKTVFVNFTGLCKKMHRQPDHVMTFLLAELGTSGSLDGQQRLVVKGRFGQIFLKGSCVDITMSLSFTLVAKVQALYFQRRIVCFSSDVRRMVIGIKNSTEDVCEIGSLRFSTVYPPRSYWNEENYDEDDMLCQLDDEDDLMVGGSNRFNSASASADDDMRQIDDEDDLMVGGSNRFNSVSASADDDMRQIDDEDDLTVGGSNRFNSASASADDDMRQIDDEDDLTVGGSNRFNSASASADDDMCRIDDEDDLMVGRSNRFNSTSASADDDMCRIDDEDDLMVGRSNRFNSTSASADLNKIQKKFDDADARLGVERRIADIGNQLTRLTQIMEAMRSQFDSWFTKHGRATGSAMGYLEGKE